MVNFLWQVELFDDSPIKDEVALSTIKRLVGCGIRNTWPTFKTKMLIYQSKTKVDVNFFAKHSFLSLKIWKILVKVLHLIHQPSIHVHEFLT